MSADIESIIRVSRQAIAQGEHTPEHERMSCRRLLELALPFLERARLADDIAAIHSAASRKDAALIRDRAIAAVQCGSRPQGDWNAVCAAVMDKWGPAALGSYSEGFARTGD